MSLQITGCTGDGAQEPNLKSVPWPGAPEVALSPAQSQTLDEASALLEQGETQAAIDKLFSLQGEVGNNSELNQTLGKALATRNGMSLDEFMQRLTPDQASVTVTDYQGVQETLVRTPSVVTTLQSMVGYSPDGFDNAISEGDDLLRLMTNNGNIDISALSAEEQQALALAATVQSMRIVAQAMGGTTVGDVNDVSTLLTANYTPQMQASLELATSILGQTSGTATSLLTSNGTDEDASAVTNVINGLAKAGNDGDVSAEELGTLLASFAPLVTG